MATKFDDEAKVARDTDHETSPPPTYENVSVQEDNAYVYADEQKLGYTGTVFVILNKMIGTGSTYTPPSEQDTCLLALQSSLLHLVSSL